jgi:hypothetical protein
MSKEPVDSRYIANRGILHDRQGLKVLRGSTAPEFLIVTKARNLVLL